MDEKRKVRGNFRIYLQWPIFLSVLMVLLTAAVGAVSLRAGIIVSFFYSYLYWNSVMDLLFQKKGHSCRTDRIFTGLRQEQK